MNHTQQRIELTAALRWASRLGWQSGICNHFSLAVDESEDGPAGILINPQGYQWSELTASSLLLMDQAGKIIDGEGSVERTAFFIHLGIHNAEPLAKCVLHSHPPYTTAIMCTKPGRLVNCHQDSLIFHKRIAYDDNFGGIANSENEGGRIASTLASKPIVLMANHGVSVTGKSVAHALDDFYYLESAAKFQVLAQSTGNPLNIIADEDADRMASGFGTDENQIKGHMDSILRILTREEPDFTN
jgi:ribulose-5-phosphate 4-epimerase/fuculose-1-phosphate aldolase